MNKDTWKTRFGMGSNSDYCSVHVRKNEKMENMEQTNSCAVLLKFPRIQHA